MRPSPPDHVDDGVERGRIAAAWVPILRTLQHGGRDEPVESRRDAATARRGHRRRRRQMRTDDRRGLALERRTPVSAKKSVAPIW
jgi:hypothetical protein